MHGILNEYENKQFSFPEDSKPSETETDVRVDRIKHKVIFHLFWEPEIT